MVLMRGSLSFSQGGPEALWRDLGGGDGEPLSLGRCETNRLETRKAPKAVLRVSFFSIPKRSDNSSISRQVVVRF